MLRKICIFLLLLLLSSTSQLWAAEYWAAPTDAGDCYAVGTPGSLKECLALLSKGDTLWLKDGTYHDANSMLSTVLAGVTTDGTEAEPITVKAVNDGLVNIDGENTWNPIYLEGNDWWVIEGVNAYNSSGTVVLIKASTNVKVKRVVAWNAPSTTNNHVFAPYQSTNILFEDCAGFGNGRKILGLQAATNITARRFWGKWENSTRTDPKLTFELTYSSTGHIFDNCIGTWDGDAGEEQWYGIISAGYSVGGVNMDGGGVYGSIAYVENEVTYPPSDLFFATNMSNFTIKDCVAYSEKAKVGFNLGAAGGGGSNPNASSLTSISASSDSIHADWSASDVEHGANIGAVSSIWTSATGAQIYYRYVDGVLTNTPLWPWPMDQRIYDALVIAGETPFYVT